MTDTDLDLLQEFVNTRDMDGDDDSLGSPELLADWLRSRGLLSAGSAVEPAAHERALAVREGIRALARANNEEPMDGRAVAAMNRAAASIPLTVRLEPVVGEGAWALLPGAGEVDGFVGRILGTVATSMADGSWSRIKACRNESCQWLFHDRSRNRSGTWCTMAICGSRMKARAYRARRRESASA